MRRKFKKINGVIAKGKDLKLLIHRPSGILVYRDNELVFVGIDDPIKLVLPHLPQKAEEKIVFISNEFDSIQKLVDDKEYLLVFNDGCLTIQDKNNNMKLLLSGITI